MSADDPQGDGALKGRSWWSPLREAGTDTCQIRQQTIKPPKQHGSVKRSTCVLGRTPCRDASREIRNRSRGDKGLVCLALALSSLCTAPRKPCALRAGLHSLCRQHVRSRGVSYCERERKPLVQGAFGGRRTACNLSEEQRRRHQMSQWSRRRGRRGLYFGSSNVSLALITLARKDKSKDLWSQKLWALYFAKRADFL